MLNGQLSIQCDYQRKDVTNCLANGVKIYKIELNPWAVCLARGYSMPLGNLFTINPLLW